MLEKVIITLFTLTKSSKKPTVVIGIFNNAFQIFSEKFFSFLAFFDSAQIGELTYNNFVGIRFLRLMFQTYKNFVKVFFILQCDMSFPQHNM